MGELNLDELERLAKAAGADAGIGAWEASDCAVWFPDGDGAMRVGERALVGIAHANLGAWPEMVDEEAVAEHIAAACPDTILALIARIRELEQERDHYRMAAEAEARFADEARAKVRELEQALQGCVDAMLHNGVPVDHEHPERVALVAAQAAIDAARKEKGHG